MFGYGYSDYKNSVIADNLLRATLRYVEKPECVRVFGNRIVSDKTFCAQGISDNVSVCNGDQGGPVIDLLLENVVRQ